MSYSYACFARKPIPLGVGVWQAYFSKVQTQKSLANH